MQSPLSEKINPLLFTREWVFVTARAALVFARVALEKIRVGIIHPPGRGFYPSVASDSVLS